MKLLYLANIRLPTEKAHGLQITQMCEAFAQHGAQVTLYAARRINTEALRDRDPYTYYGVSRNFAIRRVLCLDLLALSRGRVETLAFAIQTLTYTLTLAARLLFTRADVYYSRDALTLLVLGCFKPRRTLVYEAHQVYQSRRGAWLQQQVCRRVALTVAITGPLAERMHERGAARTLIAHDGFRAERFANLPDKAAARDELQLPQGAFIVGYAGRLHTMGQSKGIDTLIAALARMADVPVTLLLIGGPDKYIAQYWAAWSAAGLPPERLHTPGTLPAAAVPRYLAACDCCAMPTPYTEHFALYTSALKLFEYMAAGRAILASDFPAVAEVVQNDVSALLVPAGDPAAFAGALRRLATDAALCERLGNAARQTVQAYTWHARAGHILNAINDED